MPSGVRQTAYRRGFCAHSLGIIFGSQCLPRALIRSSFAPVKTPGRIDGGALISRAASFRPGSHGDTLPWPRYPSDRTGARSSGCRLLMSELMPSGCCRIWPESADSLTPLGISNYSALSASPHEAALRHPVRAGPSLRRGIGLSFCSVLSVALRGTALTRPRRSRSPYRLPTHRLASPSRIAVSHPARRLRASAGHSPSLPHPNRIAVSGVALRATARAAIRAAIHAAFLTGNFRPASGSPSNQARP